MNYSEDDQHRVVRILRSSNFYEILDVPSNATNKEIKTAFNKLAVLVHPDKNHAPDAGKAFIAVKNATANLMDEGKRRKYDEYLRNPTLINFDQFKLSESTITTILTTTGIVTSIIGAAALFASYWLSKQNNSEQCIEQNKKTKNGR